MNKVILIIALVMVTVPAYAMTQKQEQRHRRHEHMHKVHKETLILRKWMAASEKNCIQSRGKDFHECYIQSIKNFRTKNKIKFSPETEKAYRGAITPPRHAPID